MFARPIVEYAAVDCSEVGAGNYSIFDENEYGSHAYWGSIFDRLKASHGIYIFYDSMSRPLYVGIAPKQSLWIRANQSYNAARGKQGRLLGATHPVKNMSYDPSGVRKLKRTDFTLADVATYFSAYEVTGDLIGGLEAFAVRAFGGVLMNTKMEGNGGFGLEPVEGEE